MAPPTPVDASPQILETLKSLHAQSLTQEEKLDWDSLPDQSSAAFDDIMREKFIAMDQDKCEFVYHVLRSIGAKTVVEAGTSFGVSTIYLALAVAHNPQQEGFDAPMPKIIATEKEPSKASEAQKNWERTLGSDVSEMLIDLRVGDVRETLKRPLPGSVDFLLLDIWTPLALPVLEIVQRSLRPGAVIMADNTVKAAAKYAEFFAYVDDPGTPFRRVTLPYEGGLDMIVYG